jgi:hypothetical protein
MTHALCPQASLEYRILSNKLSFQIEMSADEILPWQGRKSHKLRLARVLHDQGASIWIRKEK